MKAKISMFENKNNNKESKPNVPQTKNVPKKFDTRRLSIFEAVKKKEESTENTGNDYNDKKFDRRMSLQVPPTFLAKKMNVEERLKKMNEEQAKKYAKNESTKIPPKMISIDDYLKKLKSSGKKATVIKRKKIKKLDTTEYLNNMVESHRAKEKDGKKNDEDAFENLTIRNRSGTVRGRLSDIKAKELEKKRIEEERKLMEEERIRMREERKRREEERKKREEEERKIREEEERKKREEEERKREEERKKREEEERKREEERKKREEEERIQREKDRVKYEEERKKREEEERIENERRRKEEEERRRREEEERIRREEEERKRIAEENEKFKIEGLKRLNKREEDLSEDEIKNLIESMRYEKKVEDYNNVKFKAFSLNSEGRDIRFSFEEINQIATEKISDLEVTKTGKIITLTNENLSKITIYNEETYQEEDCILLESKVNTINVDDKNIYCALDEEEDNILIISLNNYLNRIYLSGHNCGVTGLTLTKYGYMVSADIEGNVVVWSNNEVKKKGNDFCSRINTISEARESQQGIAVLSFGKEQIKFYDLRYSILEAIETINNIKGSGLKNNMLKLNENILAVAGTYIYIIDLNISPCNS